MKALFARPYRKFFLVGIMLLLPFGVFAQSAAEIQAQIDANNQKVAAIEAEIAAFQKELDVLGAKKSTLQSAISTLNISQKQLASQIQLTQSKIASANLQIKELSFSIEDKEASIVSSQNAVSKALRIMAEEEQTPFAVSIISARSLSSAWQIADAAVQFNRALSENIADLRTVRTALATNRDAVANTKERLLTLQSQLSLQKRSVDANKTAQQQLLSQTKNQETGYQQLIAQKQAAQKSFEQELLNLQGQLDLIVHPDRLPRVGSGVLTWPFSLSFMNNCAGRKTVFGNIFCVSQFFGNTPFSTSNPQIYNGGGHPGMDIATPIGTAVRSAMSGTVLETGNTDLVRGCYSFGKWVMVIHGNGLSTMYAHLSTIDVSKGQYVNTGQVLGLSGMTGYATGPHLHFGVYATEGTQIMTLRQFRGAKIGCADATMPVATLTAYLNPLSYL